MMVIRIRLAALIQRHPELRRRLVRYLTHDTLRLVRERAAERLAARRRRASRVRAYTRPLVRASRVRVYVAHPGGDLAPLGLAVRALLDLRGAA